MVVDDDKWMRHVMGTIFEKMKNVNAIFSDNGFDAVNMAITHKPAVIFLDLMMPGISGVATLKMLKAIDLTKDISVVVTTANSDYENLGAVLRLGAVNFVVKPFSYNTIVEKFNSVISNNRISSSNTPKANITPKTEEDKYNEEFDMLTGFTDSIL